jgi:FKBP-type peptidyl-prolyl cis-trans isomerase (trigger factor)
MEDSPTHTQPPVDPSKIKIEITALDAPDYRIDFEMPAELVSEIYGRLKDGGYDYNVQQMTSLLAKICIDEGLIRFDKNSIWGPKPMPESAPGIFSEDTPFIFSAVIDEIPLEHIDNIESILIERRVLKVSENLIEDEIFEQQLLFGSREAHVGMLAYGDEIICKATLSVVGKDEPEFSIDDCKIQIPKEGQPLIIGNYQCNAGDQLHNAQVGDTTICFELDNKQLELVLVNMTAERITPCQFEEVLKQYGTPNDTILKAQIKLSLQRNFDRQNDAMMRRQLFDYLFETIDVPVSSRIVDEHFVELCKKEEGENELNEEDRSKLLKKAKEIAKKRVIVACYQKKFNIYINEQDVQQQICDIAESRRVRPEEIKEEFVSGGKMDALAALVKEKKIFKHLKDKMVFTDVS